ncbi:MAG: hypothetical protein ACXACK_19530 [Candidatus Hodarchaeales archaeon]|jgi:hypothetical protein
MLEVTLTIIMSATLVGTIIISYLLTIVIPNKVLLPKNLVGQKNFHKLLVMIIIIALVDFYFVFFVPVVKRLSDPLVQTLILGFFLILSLLVIIVTVEFKKVIIDIKISLIKRNLQFLKYSIQLILIQEMIVSFFYIVSLFSIFLGQDNLPGIAFIFDIQESELADITLLTEVFPLISVLLLAGIKGAFLLLHHGSIIVIFITLYVIFEEWNGRTRETTVTFFRWFALGLIIQGVGQIIQSFGLLYSSFVLSANDAIPIISSVPITLGSFFTLIGAITYFISFMLAAVSLLGNISHMLVPPMLIAFYKIVVIVIPVIYGILYGLLFLMNLFWLFNIGDTALGEFADIIETTTHLLDLPAMILLPFTCGLFFLVAYRQSREEKKGIQLSNYVLWTFLSLFLIFGTGNNTMSTVSWFGMLHGPLALLGAITLLYGLSRVADHASRYRRVINHIRETPNDFLFLAQLGEAERKIKIWSKVDSLVKTGIIKPLVPTNTPPDEIKVAAEINAYMAEISAQFKRKRRPIPN